MRHERRLDWRLASDVAEIAAAVTISEQRWLGEAERLVGTFARDWGESDLHSDVAAGMPVVRRGSKRVVVLGHPLRERGLPIQAERTLLEQYAEIRYSDLYVLAREPQNIASWLLR